MNLKNIGLAIIALCVVSITQAQVTEAEKDLKKKKEVPDSLQGWEKGGVGNITFSQVSLTNWAGGGQNSISLNGYLNLFADLTTKFATWENELNLGYGVLKQGKSDLFKSDDKLEFSSKYGYKASKNLYYAGLLNFRSQFAPGYNSPADTAKISDLLAPAYILGAAGIDYKPNKKFSLFVAPLTGKVTIVNNQTLADAGAFGVNPGSNVRSEFGGYLKLRLKVDIMENIKLQTSADMFSNYLHNPQNIDVNWETLIAMKVNKYITVNLSTHLIYDDDIDIQVDEDDDGVTDATGPRVQFKQVLAVGFSYKF